MVTAIPNTPSICLRHRSMQLVANLRIAHKSGVHAAMCACVYVCALFRARMFLCEESMRSCGKPRDLRVCKYAQWTAIVPSVSKHLHTHTRTCTYARCLHAAVASDLSKSSIPARLFFVSCPSLPSASFLICSLPLFLMSSVWPFGRGRL